jgi:hypothetical protein
MKAGPRSTLFAQGLAKVSPTAPAPVAAPPAPKKRAAPREPPSLKKKFGPAARYISRHRIKPPRSGP